MLFFFSFLGIIILIAIPLFTVGVRRLHDTNKSGQYYFWNLVPFIGGIIFIAFMIGVGTKGSNKYGPDPLKKSIKKRKEKKIILGFYRITCTRLAHKEIKLKKFTYWTCSIINIDINTHENNSCPRGEIGSTKDLKNIG